MLDDGSDKSYLLFFRRFFFFMRFFQFDLLELVSFDELDFFDDESGDDGSGSWSPGMCALPFCSGNSLGRVSVVGS